jgi:hypothetical protein
VEDESAQAVRGLELTLEAANGIWRKWS